MTWFYPKTIAGLLVFAAVGSMTPFALGQSSKTSKTTTVGMRAATKTEMNTGKMYLGIGRPSSLPRHVQMTPENVKFLKSAAVGGKLEVKLCQIGLEKATNEEVRKFTQQVQDDHIIANEQLYQLSRDKRINLPSALDANYQAMIDQLSGLQGADFDKAYMKAMVDTHEKAVKRFTSMANSGENSDVRTWASTLLPTLRKHRDMARQLSDTVGAASTTTTPPLD